MEPAGWERRYDGAGYQKALEPQRRHGAGLVRVIGGSIVCAGWLLG